MSLVSGCQRGFVDSLDHAVARSCNKSKTCQIDLQQVAGSDWDYLVDCDDSASASQISAAVGFSMPEPKEFTRRDIFVKGGKVVRYDLRPENAERPDFGEVYFDDGTQANCVRIERSNSLLTVNWATAGEKALSGRAQ